MPIIDLSVLLSRDMPCTWPGHVPFAHQNWNWYTGARGPYSTHFIMIDEHCGTHMDAATHFIPPPDSGLPWAGPLGAESTEHVDLNRLTGPAVVVDVRHLSGTGTPGCSPPIEPDHLLAHEADRGRFRPGDAVLLRTGWDRYYTSGPEAARFAHEPLVTRAAPAWPAPSTEAMLLLHERGVRLVGIDSPSMGAAHDGVPVHVEGLSRGMLYVEMLTNLGGVPASGATFLFLPLRLAGGTGGPGRAIALR